MNFLKKIVEDNIECAFPNVDIVFHIFLTLMITNCSSKLSFSQLKTSATATRQAGRLSSTKYRSRCVRKINFEDLIKDFAIKKSRIIFFKYK